MHPNIRLMARAFHRIPPKPTPSTTLQNHIPCPTLTSRSRRLSTTSPRQWEGRKAEENTTREKDSHNVQHDAVKEGKKERAEGGGASKAVSEESGGKNESAKEEFPEAPDTIGMVDERGGKD